LGGRAAETLVMKELTTGAGNDIERATSLARKMVCEWGMSSLGPLTFGKKDEEIFLGREIATHKDYSEKTAELIDDEITQIVTNAEKKALSLVRKHVDKLHALAKALLEREILDGSEIDKVLKGEVLGPLPDKKEDKNNSGRKRKRAPKKEVANNIK